MANKEIKIEMMANDQLWNEPVDSDENGKLSAEQITIQWWNEPVDSDENGKLSAEQIAKDLLNTDLYMCQECRNVPAVHNHNYKCDDMCDDEDCYCNHEEDWYCDDCKGGHF